MANVIKVQEFGNQLAVLFDDGTRQLAYPTVGGLWVVRTTPDPPPPPVVPPPSTKRFITPFSFANDVSSEYGPRSGRVHQGIDFSSARAHNGADVRAAGSGRVRTAANAGNGVGFGWHVILDHGDNIFTVYGHMIANSLTVNIGQTVQQGQVLGKVGNTGNSFGAHLHWETHVGGLGWSNPGPHRNPRDFMAQYG